jgi:antitoxin ParD1/3/4
MANVHKISIALPADMVDVVRKAVDGGDYSSASEVVREALRDWKEKQEHKAVALKELRRLVRQGLDSGPGRFASMDEIKAEARRRFAGRKPAG